MAVDVPHDEVVSLNSVLEHFESIFIDIGDELTVVFWVVERFSITAAATTSRRRGGVANGSGKRRLLLCLH